MGCVEGIVSQLGCGDKCYFIGIGIIANISGYSSIMAARERDRTAVNGRRIHRLAKANIDWLTYIDTLFVHNRGHIIYF